ncbi:unnamed protein product [Debaryomyces tyrocola]|nr:unnamed protein product [Debaryomyces tyrocola]
MSKVEYQKLGASGLSISPIIIGCMTFGDFQNWGITEEETVMEILKKCYDNGLRTFDTADVYSNGASEIFLGKFIKKYSIPRERIVILTKVWGTMDYNDPDFNMFKYGTEAYPEINYVNSQGLSRKHILDAVEHSIKNLGTYIDILQIHRLDRSTPKNEIMKALNDVVESGQVRYLGASSMKAFEFAQLQFIAEKNNWAKFISMQNYYNLVYREEEREMIPFCKENDFGKIGVIPYSPIASGLLARPLSSDGTKRLTTDAIFSKKGLDKPTDSDKEIVTRVQKLAEKYKVSMAAVATRWVLSKGANPIVGVNSVERVDDFMKALSMELTESEIYLLEEPYVAKAEYKI